MKRVWIMLLIVAVLFTGCGGGDKPEPKTEADETVKVDVDKKKDSTLITTEDGQEIEVAADMEKGIDLPEEYPKDLLPLYSDEFIAVAMKQPDGSFSVVAMTEDSVGEVKEFYKKLLEDADVITTQQEEDFYMNMGTINGSTYTVMIEEEEDEDNDYHSRYTLMIIPGEDTGTTVSEEDEDNQEDNESAEKIEAEVVIPDDVNWPEDYPSVVLPIYPTGNTQAAMGDAGMVGIMTEDQPEDVVEYYKELLKEADDYGEMAMGPMTMVSGTIEGKFFQVTIGLNDENTGEDIKFKTLVQVVYQ